jgi:hypothetical protein
MVIHCQKCQTECVEHHDFNDDTDDTDGYSFDVHCHDDNTVCDGSRLCPRCDYYKLEKIDCGICAEIIEKYHPPSSPNKDTYTVFKCSCCHSELDHPDDMCNCIYNCGTNKKKWKQK